MAFTSSNDIHYYASLISMKNNEALFYWHLELLHCTLLHSFQEMMKGKVEQSGLSLLLSRQMFCFISKVLNRHFEIFLNWFNQSP